MKKLAGTFLDSQKVRLRNKSFKNNYYVIANAFLDFRE